jgi:hypothetical protein
MCGYDRSRFINLDDDDEYTCFICKNIYNDPVELPCCKNLVCKACIEIWASNNSTCPLDKRRIDSKNLQKPARQFINLMSKMKLKCEFFNKGCQAIYELGEIKRHEEECDFNICENCCFKVGKKSDHNCISNLKLELQNQREALNKQKSLFFEAEIKSKRDCSKLKLEYDKECINLKIKCEELRLKYAKELEVLKLRQIKDRSSISQLTESNEILSKENSDLKTILQKYEVKIIFIYITQLF